MNCFCGVTKIRWITRTEFRMLDQLFIMKHEDGTGTELPSCLGKNFAIERFE